MKIALIGVENSHADAFWNLIYSNKEKYGDVSIEGVFSEEDGATDRFNCFKAEKYDGFLGKVDAVMITVRHGDNHYKYAMPYVKAGIPCFIDKPFCASLEKARELIKIAQENGVPLCGGSCVKFLDEIKPLNRLKKEIKVTGGTCICPISPEAKYGGFWFYSQHLVELMIAVFGKGVKSVTAYFPDENKKRLSCIFNYGAYDVLGLYNASQMYYANVVGEEFKFFEARCDNVAYTFEHELDEFLQMAESGVMPQSYDDLIYPVKVLDAIERSYKTKKEAEVL